MRTTLTTAAVVALIAASAGPAVAKPDIPTARGDAALHAQAMRAQGIHEEQLAAVAASRPSTPPAVVHVTHTPLVDGGFDWADAGIGAGFAAALMLSVAGVSVARRHPPMPLR
jgi:hypothetical protein